MNLAPFSINIKIAMLGKQRTPFKRIAIISASVIAAGTAGYVLIEGWNFLDALFMTIITVTTIGYGEINPLTAAGRIFTILLIAGGLGAVASAAAALGTFLIETAVSGTRQRRKTMKTIDKLKDHWILCGYGGAGTAVALRLAEYEIPFVVLDLNEESCEQAQRSGFITLCADASKDASLESARVRRCAGILIMLPDFSTEIVITMAVREMNPDSTIVVRGDDSSIEERFKRAGADIVVYPLKLGGERVAAIAARYSGRKTSETLGGISTRGYRLGLYKNYSTRQQTVKEAVTHSKCISAVAMVLPDGTRIENPPEETVLEPGDTLVVVTSAEKTDLEKIGFRAEWREEMSVGVPRFDEEHRRLVGLINNLSDIVVSGAGPEEAGPVFDRLVEYTISHFHNEEEFLKSIKYPDLTEHLREHQVLTETVMELNRDRHSIFPDNVAEFLTSWLKNHILGSDKKYGTFVS